MLTKSIFLGVILDGTLLACLKNLDPQITALFIDNGADYLQSYNYQQNQYLGKSLIVPASLGTIQLLENNINSLISRLITSYQFKDHSLILLPHDN